MTNMLSPKFTNSINDAWIDSNDPNCLYIDVNPLFFINGLTMVFLPYYHPLLHIQIQIAEQLKEDRGILTDILSTLVDTVHTEKFGSKIS